MPLKPHHRIRNGWQQQQQHIAAGFISVRFWAILFIVSVKLLPSWFRLQLKNPLSLLCEWVSEILIYKDIR
ncbi:MAG: hypothetical protein DMG67_08045 [Acidobacteria bacterium]|nr:MAG: hypothetical protein DMG67_08045 [Acidobacteriota bacterium]